MPVEPSSPQSIDTLRQSSEALSGPSPDKVSGTKTGAPNLLERLTRIAGSAEPGPRNSRPTHAMRDARSGTVLAYPSTGADFSPPDEVSNLSVSVQDVAVEAALPETDYDQIDGRLDAIYARWNIDDYINGDDISSLVNALHHNQNNEYFDDELRAINILSAKLLIEDTTHSELDPDFVKSLKLSILYTDLKSKEDEPGVKALLNHVANTQDQNLFVLEMLSSSDRRSSNAHATGRVITRHPDAPSGKPLVSVNINKGYIANPDERGQYTFRMLSEEPSMRDLRYPKQDAHSNQSRLSGRSQEVGNCGVIAFKEALQVARAFENPQFKKAFFVRNRLLNPFGGIGSKKLKAQFKANYGFGADRKIRVQDKLLELLLNKLRDKAKAVTDLSDPIHAEVRRVEGLSKIRRAQKLDRDAAKSGKITNPREAFRTISPEIIQKVGLSPADGEHLSDVKTAKRTGPGVIRYLGLNGSSQLNSDKLIGTLNDLWQREAGTFDEKANHTKQLLKMSIDSTRLRNPKIDLIEQLVRLDGLNLAPPEAAKTVKSIIREAAIDQLHRFHTSSNHKQLLRDPRVKNMVSTLVKQGNLDTAQRILRALVFHSISDKEGPLQAIRRLFIEDPKTVNERNTKAFVEIFINDDAFMADLQSAITTEQGDTHLRHWISLIDRFVDSKAASFKDPEDGETGPTAVEQTQALKLGWAPALLQAGEQKLSEGKHRDREEGIYAIKYAIKNLGADQNSLQDPQALTSALTRSLTEQTGNAFLVAVAMTQNSNVAKAAIQGVAPEMLAKKLLAEYQVGGNWEKSNTSWALNLLDPVAKEIFLKGIIEKPADFKEVRTSEKSNLVFVVNQLLLAGTDSAKQVASDFIAKFTDDLKTDLAQQLDLINSSSDSEQLNKNYVENLVEFIRLSQNQETPLKLEDLISKEQAGALVTALSDSANMKPSPFDSVFKVLTTYAQLHPEPNHQRSVYGSLIDASQNLIDSGDTEKASSGVLRLAYLSTNPINLDITDPGDGNKQALIDSLVAVFSDPDTSSDTRFNSYLLLSQPLIANQVRIAVNNNSSSDFVSGLTALADSTGGVQGAENALELADVFLPTGRSFTPPNDFNNTALGRSPDLRAKFLNAIADQSALLLGDSDPATKADGILRLAQLVLPPLSADLSQSTAAIADKLVPALVKIFSDPNTTLSTRHNIHLILSAQHVSPQANQLLGEVADDAFVDALVNYAKYPHNNLGGEDRAWEIVQLLNNVNQGDKLADQYFDKLSR